MIRYLAERRDKRRATDLKAKREGYGYQGQQCVAPGVWASGLEQHAIITERGSTVEYRRVEKVVRLDGEWSEFVAVFFYDEHHPFLMHKSEMVLADSGVIGSRPGGGD
jgi:hypothetical protein